MSILFRLFVHLRQQVQLTDMPSPSGLPSEPKLAVAGSSAVFQGRHLQALARVPASETVLINVLHFQPLQPESQQ